MIDLSWDDWVPQDRLRKLNDENKELAKNLKKELDNLRQRAAPKTVTASSKKKAAGSDLSSARGSEERHSSVPATGRGQKRGRDFEIEKVGEVRSPLGPYSVSRDNVFRVQSSPQSSPGLPGFPKVVRWNNSRIDRSPPDLGWLSPASKRLCLSQIQSAQTGGKSVEGRSTPKPQTAPRPLSPLSPCPKRSWKLLSPPHTTPKSSPPSLLGRPDGSSLRRGCPPNSPPNSPPGVTTRRRARISAEKAVAISTEKAVAVPFKRIPLEDRFKVTPFYAVKENGGLINLLDGRNEYPVSKANLAARRAIRRRHPRLCNDAPYNFALECFYKGQDPDQVIMIAGIPPDNGPHRP